MKLSLKIIIHTIYWLVFSQFSFMVDMRRSLGEWPYVNNLTPHFIINFLWAGIIFYLFYFYFIRFFERHQFVKYLIFSIVSSVLLTFLLSPLHKFFYPHFEVLNLKFLIPPMIGTFIIAQSGCMIRGFENWFTNIQLKSELDARNLRNELELLKSQINPHFLFNSLNNIDSLIRTNPEDASNSLVKLSEMLRYMIYETKTDKVMLNQEIIYLNNYISLQQLRLSKKNQIRFQFPEKCSDIKIAPMLLIPFVENAFKFALKSGSGPAIDISLQCIGNSLKFSCENNYKKGEEPTPEIHGIGIENVKRRLEILYPGKHQLTISDHEPVFKVELSLLLE